MTRARPRERIFSCRFIPNIMDETKNFSHQRHSKQFDKQQNERKNKSFRVFRSLRQSTVVWRELYFAAYYWVLL